MNEIYNLRGNDIILRNVDYVSPIEIEHQSKFYPYGKEPFEYNHYHKFTIHFKHSKLEITGSFWKDNFYYYDDNLKPIKIPATKEGYAIWKERFMKHLIEDREAIIKALNIYLSNYKTFEQ